MTWIALAVAARLHSLWQISTNTFAHQGVGGTWPWDRLVLFGQGPLVTFSTAENIGWQGEFPTAPDMEHYTIELQEGLFRDDGRPASSRPSASRRTWSWEERTSSWTSSCRGPPLPPAGRSP